MSGFSDRAQRREPAQRVERVWSGKAPDGIHVHRSPAVEGLTAASRQRQHASSFTMSTADGQEREEEEEEEEEEEGKPS